MCCAVGSEAGELPDPAEGDDGDFGGVDEGRSGCAADGSDVAQGQRTAGDVLGMQLVLRRQLVQPHQFSRDLPKRRRIQSPAGSSLQQW